MLRLPQKNGWWFVESNEKPKAKFCWLCGKKLWGNKGTVAHIDGHERILHKECAKDPEKMYQLKVQEEDQYGPK